MNSCIGKDHTAVGGSSGTAVDVIVCRSLNSWRLIISFTFSTVCCV